MYEFFTSIFRLTFCIDYLHRFFHGLFPSIFYTYFQKRFLLPNFSSIFTNFLDRFFASIFDIDFFIDFYVNFFHRFYASIFCIDFWMVRSQNIYVQSLKSPRFPDQKQKQLSMFLLEIKNKQSVHQKRPC